MTEPEINMQNYHNHCRGSGSVQVNAAGQHREFCGCGMSLIRLRLGTVIPINCLKIDAELLAKCII